MTATHPARIGRVICFSVVSAAAASMLCVVLTAQTVTHVVPEVPERSLSRLTWITIASDPQGDGLQARLPDARELAYAIERPTDTVWFRLTLFGPLPERWLGISVAIDNDGDPDNGATWWGTNKVRFDRMASAFVSRTENEWQGFAGVGDAASVTTSDTTNVTRDVRIALNRADRWIALGVPRASLGPAFSIRVMATVGSMVKNNDDIPNAGMVRVELPR